MFRRTVLTGTLGAAALPVAARAQGRDLTVVSWGGAYQDAQREVFFRPFQQQTRTRMLEETWDGGIGVLRGRVTSGANTWDVVQVESEELLLGADEGLFEPMDWAAIGGRDAYIPQAVNDFGVGAILYSFILAFDRARMPQGPATWAEFFDTARFPGKRGLRHQTQDAPFQAVGRSLETRQFLKPVHGAMLAAVGATGIRPARASGLWPGSICGRGRPAGHHWDGRPSRRR
jgi:spermidine/putrescine-binding protein